MHSINLYYHGGSTNHGCEAIVRSTKKILDAPLTLFSYSPETDREYGLEQLVSLMHDDIRPLRRNSLRWLLSAVHHKLTRTDLLHTWFCRNAFFSQIKRGDICLSIGGDNYCYVGQDLLSYYNRLLHWRGAKTILWGCSVEPSLLADPDIAKDLSRYDLITARETISYEALRKVNPNTVLVADPAFVLDKVELPLPDGWVEDKMIGINASPLILQAGDSRTVFLAYRALIQYITERTDYHVVLIPHVVAESSDDRQPLKQLFEQFRDTGRVILLGDHTCEELKGYISRCSYFVGARTHSTIAAYSSGVPTLVVGYSVKSRGIARDLFGTEENYVLPVQKIDSEFALTDAFAWIMEHGPQIRSHLQTVLPGYTEQAYCGAENIIFK